MWNQHAAYVTNSMCSKRNKPIGNNPSWFVQKQRRHWTERACSGSKKRSHWANEKRSQLQRIIAKRFTESSRYDLPRSMNERSNSAAAVSCHDARRAFQEYKRVKKKGETWEKKEGKGKTAARVSRWNKRKKERRSSRTEKKAGGITKLPVVPTKAKPDLPPPQCNPFGFLSLRWNNADDGKTKK